MIKQDVTIQAMAIFGEDIVVKAYQDISYYRAAENIISNSSIEPADACPVYVEFVNGKKIKIWASEWSGVTVVE